MCPTCRHWLEEKCSAMSRVCIALWSHSSFADDANVSPQLIEGKDLQKQERANLTGRRGCKMSDPEHKVSTRHWNQQQQLQCLLVQACAERRTARTRLPCVHTSHDKSVLTEANSSVICDCLCGVLHTLKHVQAASRQRLTWKAGSEPLEAGGKQQVLVWVLKRLPQLVPDLPVAWRR